MAGQSAGSWTHSGLAAGDIVYKEDVKDLRDNLNEALTALGIQTANWEDAVLQGAPNGTLIRAVHITQLRTDNQRQRRELLLQIDRTVRQRLLRGYAAAAAEFH